MNRNLLELVKNISHCTPNIYDNETQTVKNRLTYFFEQAEGYFLLINIPQEEFYAIIAKQYSTKTSLDIKLKIASFSISQLNYLLNNQHILFVLKRKEFLHAIDQLGYLAEKKS